MFEASRGSKTSLNLFVWQTVMQRLAGNNNGRFTPNAWNVCMHVDKDKRPLDGRQTAVEHAVRRETF